ncbi:ribonuclease J [Heyndrickxia ginsengihumi]|uniref:Ribonuclease J n=1 Tax=Heyndrickxia ginsengihumi TaxID=363870 RepID=A0A6M0PBB9_9BACI|nr:ribonuclease J [Heyndrickxia ginsengihumi]MBE6182809.1 ribonuclease J [Bacillus sp. (in: firmicutes)]MCM3022549.1 ribonuclease J [Heyndrickxia ginsengihumi]NEY21220.1 ribonuclease J [Heyndrickxia ginsengihumi]
MKKEKNETIKVIPLGGVGEVGKNLYVVEVDDDIFVLDAGLMFPEDEMLGIDIVIPDFKYLEENKHKIRGIFLTHGHEDAIGALPYMLMKLNVPVYATKLTIALVKEKLKEVKLKKSIQFVTIHADTVLHFDSVDIRFFRTTHSIPDSVGICIHTSEGNIVYTGDFKFDQELKGPYRSEIGKMANIGDEGVLFLLSDSTEAEHPGLTIRESIVAEEISHAFFEAKGRIIIASFALNLIRIQQILNSACETNRKVAIVGKYLERIYKIAIKLGYLTAEADNLIIPIHDISKYDDHELVILTTGSQGEPFLVLQKMAKNSHKYVNVKKGDTVFLAVSPSPGLELFVAKTVDMLYRAGATVFSSKRNIHVTGHGCQEDLKLMLGLMKPRYFIPVQGEYRSLYTHAKLAQQVGIPKESIIISSNGEVIEYKQEKLTISGRVPSGNILVDGSGVGDVGNIVLRDRRLLSQDGILIVVVTLDRLRKTIAAGPEVISRGFVYVRESEKLISNSVSLVKDIVEHNMSQDSFDWTSIKQDIRDQLSSYLFEKTKRRPMILPIIMEV